MAGTSTGKRSFPDMGRTQVSLGRIKEILEKPLEDMNRKWIKPQWTGI